MSWQTMETAPKDGKEVLLKSEAVEPDALFFWERGKWRTWSAAWWGGLELDFWPYSKGEPTHWAPPI